VMESLFDIAVSFFTHFWDLVVRGNCGSKGASMTPLFTATS